MDTLLHEECWMGHELYSLGAPLQALRWRPPPLSIVAGLGNLAG
jgi:hypothetical protein